MTDYLTADLHLGHEAVACLRGFTSSTHHDQKVIANLLDTLTCDDRLYVLGDLVSGRERPGEEIRRVEELSTILDEHGVELHVIAGNHDCIHPSRSHASRHLHDYAEVVDSVAAIGTMKIAGNRAILSHYPYDGDHKAEDRDVQWRPRDLGAPIIHGHTHAADPVSRSARGTLQVCVSLDAWGMRPVAKDALSRLIESS